MSNLPIGPQLPPNWEAPTSVPVPIIEHREPQREPVADEPVAAVMSFSFEVLVAEIICRKDNADVLALTIKDELTCGLHSLATKQLNAFVSSDDGRVDIALGEHVSSLTGSSVLLQPNLFMMGGLGILRDGAWEGRHVQQALPSLQIVWLTRDGRPHKGGRSLGMQQHD